MGSSERQISGDLNTQRLIEFDSLLTELSKAEPEALEGLRECLLNVMFPTMPDAARAIVQPLFALVTLEVAAIDQARSRIGDLFT